MNEQYCLICEEDVIPAIRDDNVLGVKIIVCPHCWSIIDVELENEKV